MNIYIVKNLVIDIKVRSRTNNNLLLTSFVFLFPFLRGITKSNKRIMSEDWKFILIKRRMSDDDDDVRENLFK